MHWISTGPNLGLGTSFLIGVVASLSSCMAIVGGLLLSISANYAKAGDRVRPQLLFHTGRLLSFFLFGGVIGAAGSVFRFGDRSMFILEILISITMILLGLNLLDVFPQARKWQPALPAAFGRSVVGMKSVNNSLTPFLIGIATFILPCGFTQSMQLYAITTGHFLAGALIMFSFALGTLPILALLSFSSLGSPGRARTGLFFKTVGLVAILMAAFNLVGAGVGLESLGRPDAMQAAAPGSVPDPSSQVIEIAAKAGYTPASVHAKAGVPLTLRIKTSGTFDCSSAVRIASIGWSKNLGANAEVDVRIPPQNPGTTLVGMCSMGMYDFKITFD